MDPELGRSEKKTIVVLVVDDDDEQLAALSKAILDAQNDTNSWYESYTIQPVHESKSWEVVARIRNEEKLPWDLIIADKFMPKDVDADSPTFDGGAMSIARAIIDRFGSSSSRSRESDRPPFLIATTNLIFDEASEAGAAWRSLRNSARADAALPEGWLIDLMKPTLAAGPIDEGAWISYVSRIGEVAQQRDWQNSRVSVWSEGVFESAVMQNLLILIDRQVGSGRRTFWLRGETGVGKGHIARIIHRLAYGDQDAPLVTFSTAGSENAHLLEDELKGHVRNAFTGADSDRPGKLQQANGGTLFLDEVGKTQASPEPDEGISSGVPRRFSLVADRLSPRRGIRRSCGDRIVNVRRRHALRIWPARSRQPLGRCAVRDSTASGAKV